MFANQVKARVCAGAISVLLKNLAKFSDLLSFIALIARMLGRFPRNVYFLDSLSQLAYRFHGSPFQTAVPAH